MPLLLNTEVDNLVKSKIRGFVARAGGTVDQLIDYSLCRVEDINIPDGGFGAILKNEPHQLRRHSFPLIKRYFKQELKFLVHGSRIPRDRKTIVLDMHNACNHNELRGKYDCSISSNMLEHSPNPISLLLAFHFITKENGYQFHAIPHYAHTYDRYRNPTSLEHFIEDYENDIDTNDTTHIEDYRQSAVEKDGWQRQFHQKYPLKYPFIHFHVFDEHNVKALLEYMFQDVVNDIYKNDRFSDNVAIFRNSLRPEFVEKYRRRLEGAHY